MYILYDIILKNATNGEIMIENINQYEIEILDYYTELVKTKYLKENQNLGINARNKIIANYNRMMQAEKVAHISSLITCLGDEKTLTALSNSMYIQSLEGSTELLKTYATIKVFLAVKSQFLDENADPLQIIASFDSEIWQNDKIQEYANTALEYNRIEHRLTTAIVNINKQTKIGNK